MPLDYEATEKLHEELNALFDVRIKDRVEESIDRHMLLVDDAVKARIEYCMKESTSWLSADMGGELAKWIKRQAESAADHYIRLFGGAPALREIVERLWEKGAEKYIEGEINRRLNEILRNLDKTVQDKK